MVARQLADSCRKRVVVIDTSNEIGGDGDIPHPGIGAARRMQVHLETPLMQLDVCFECIGGKKRMKSRVWSCTLMCAWRNRKVAHCRLA